MSSHGRLPNGRVLLEGMGLTFERLQTGSKAAVSLPIIKATLFALASSLPFDPEFYLHSYPDIRSAFETGKIRDLKTHFCEIGYLEGRMGAAPEFDEDFYKATYPDIAAALEKGTLRSARDHYIYSGAFEGRNASEATMAADNRWLELLRPL